MDGQLLDGARSPRWVDTSGTAHSSMRSTPLLRCAPRCFKSAYLRLHRRLLHFVNLLDRLVAAGLARPFATEFEDYSFPAGSLDSSVLHR